MFGYIKPYKPEMKIKEYEVFKAYYCGLCKELGKNFGQAARLSLNYEHAFLAIFLSALSGEEIHMRAEACIAHPFSKRPVIRDNEFISYASHINLLLTYYKFVDLRKDGSALWGALGCGAFYRQFKKARRKYPQKAEAIDKNLKALDALERQRCVSIDEAAEPFANLMAEILFYPGMDFDKGAVSALKHLAYNLGRFIYIIDAYDDMEKDMKAGNYNALLAQCKYGHDEGGPQNFKDRVREQVSFNLTYTLNEIDQACDSLDLKKNRGIIENVVKIGLYKELERITRGDKACKTRMKF